MHKATTLWQNKIFTLTAQNYHLTKMYQNKAWTVWNFIMEIIVSNIYICVVHVNPRIISLCISFASWCWNSSNIQNIPLKAVGRIFSLNNNTAQRTQWGYNDLIWPDPTRLAVALLHPILQDTTPPGATQLSRRRGSPNSVTDWLVWSDLIRRDPVGSRNQWWK